ncbi:MAG: hypothetical protein Q8N05_20000 [Bacteroidota bacterium]|nr:hypothetical protein [Bacteroidota bacterium]
MKNKILEITKKNLSDIDGKKISRKDAIKKTAFIAGSAATMMILLNKPSQAGPECSRPAPPPKHKDDGHEGGGIWKK